jgi:hypothetical protein
MRIIVLIFVIFPFVVNAQVLTGTVYEKTPDKGLQPLMGAHLLWKGTSQGTTTNEKGKFKLKRPESGDGFLVISFVGYKSDTLRVPAEQKDINIIMKSAMQLSEVEVSDRQSGEYINKLDPIKTEVITESGLQRLACCNLSESFENSATVDVSYSDAVAGVKQIQMLGLAGIYAQIMGENMPMVKGLAYPFGLTYVPGPWLESVQVSKGSASVVNGYESITGQINTEFKKPARSEKFFLNLYGNSEGKSEMNLWSAYRFNDTLSTMTLFNAGYMPVKPDHNHDGFADVPMGPQLNLLHRWEYEIPQKICNQYMVRLNYDDRVGGETGADRNYYFRQPDLYGVTILNKRADIVAKHGFFLNRPGTSIGIQTSATWQDFNARYGQNFYNATQKSAYVNAIFQTYIGNTENIINTGLSYNYDLYEQQFSLYPLGEQEESVPGAFAQYTRHFDGVLQFIAGIRSDYHNFHGWMITPRLHLKSDFSERWTLRASIGKGYRSSLPVAENFGLMASSRNWIIAQNMGMEEAWNTGASLTGDFLVFGRKTVVSADVFRTWFVSQIIADIEKDPYAVWIYSTGEGSYSNSYQLNITQTIEKGLEYTIAARYNDVMQAYQSGIQQKPMLSPLKFLFSPTYTTKYDKWSFDGTFLWNSGGRLPDTDAKPEEYLLGETFPSYITVHAQITRRFKRWDIYAGGENLTGFVQKHPVIGHDDPFGNNFDASLIWGPVMGRTFYAGLRFKIN